MTSVCILTSAHSPFDHRIFHKQAKTLVEAGYDVTLIAHHDREETQDGVEIVPIQPSGTTIDRSLDLFRIYRTAKNTNADVFHFHDPTLLPFGAALSFRTGAKVIYDAHEDYSESFKQYAMAPDWAVPLVDRFWPTLESTLANRLDGVIGATEYIADLFREWGHENVISVHNFPNVSQMHEQEIPIDREHEYILIFTGGVGEHRGLTSMLEVTEHLQKDGYDVCLWLLGPVNVDGGEKELQSRLNREGYADYVRVLGPVDHNKVYSYQRKADIGLAYMQKEADGERYYWRGLPTKMVEYMYAELPVVATDTIGVQNYLPDECGIKIPDQHIELQADAISEFLDSPAKRTEMGKAGRKYVEETMSWNAESEKLLAFYRKLLN